LVWLALHPLYIDDSKNMTDDALDTARRALDAGDREAALDALLGAWREQNATALAELIDVVSADLARGLAPIDASGDFHAAWMAVEQDGRAADVPRLAPGLCAEPVNTLGVRLERLIARGADPRTGRALVAMIEAIPTTSSSNFPIWTRAFKAMPDMLDTSVRAELARYRSRAPKTTSKFWPKLKAWLDKLMEGLEPPVVLDEAAMKRVSAMTTRATELAKGKVAPAPRREVKSTETKPENASPMVALATAKTAADKKDWAACVENVLVAWGAVQTPDMTALLDRVSAAAAPEPSLPSAPPKIAISAWLELEAKGRACDVPELLEHLHRAPVGDVEVRLTRLLGRMPDPRVAAYAREVVLHSSANAARPGYWNAVFDLLARGVDAADFDLVRRLGENDGKPVNRGNLLYNNGPALRRNGARVTPAMRARIEALGDARTPPAVLSMIAAIDATVPAKKESPEKTMIAAIVGAKGGDDGPLLVYADWLVEQKSPRGELIMVQCKLETELEPAEKKRLVAREKALLKNKIDLFGPLAEMIVWDRATWQSGTRLERGMLVAMTIGYQSDKLLELLDHPALATVREVNLSNDADVATKLLLHPNVASVRIARGLHSAQLAAICDSERPLAIEELDIGLEGTFGDDARRAIASARGLPKLRVLSGSFWNSDGVMPEWMMKSTFFTRLEQVDIGFPNSSQVPAITGWIRGMSGLPTVPRLSLCFAGGACTVIDGVVRATQGPNERYDPVWAKALRDARVVAKEVVLEGDWPPDARGAIFSS